ncbi:MAG: C25 family cysteine peptidase, partial [Candidatus Zophobacter franzmannii]|nr:C25 family cysteine peptidase [Candidatus Zophobacter franzmannii]
MKNRLIFFLFLMLTATLFSTQTYEVSFEELQLSGITYDNRLPMIYEPGNPCLPYQPITILVPQNMQLSDLRISKHGEKITPDTDLNYVREQQTISFPKPDNTQKNSALYALDEIYPKNDYKILDAQSMNGYQIVTVMLYPYRYNPAQKELIVYNQFTVEPVYTRSAVELDTRMLSIDRKTQEKIGRLVINPEVVAGYSRSIERVEATLPDPSEPYDMIIITGTDQLPWFTEYAQWKTNHGVLTNVVSVQDIYTEYAGVDHAEQLRYFIIDAYQAYAGSSNPLKYILLGGDDEIIPIRGVYGIVGDTTDMNMPSDLYYACLDGSWDGNVNFIYGETDDNVDFYPEISVGRIPAESENEFNNFFNKAYHYVDDSSYSNN